MKCVGIKIQAVNIFLNCSVILVLLRFNSRSSVGNQGNERADVLANKGSIFGTLFQDQAGLTTVNTSDIHVRARSRLLTEWQERWNDSEMGRYCYSIKALMASTEDERVFLVAISRLASNHTGTRAHLQRINVVQRYNRPWAMGMWATLYTKKRSTRKAPSCRDRSRQVNKGYIGNVQYGRVQAHFWILKGHGFANQVKCLRNSSDSLDTGSNPNINFLFPKQSRSFTGRNAL
jgi:hypothetical protein